MGSLIKQDLIADGGFDLLGIYDIDNIAELDAAAPQADLVIDFSNKASLPHVLAYVSRTNAALVSGTTGYTEDEQAQIRALGAKSRVIQSGNYSLGVAALRHVTRLAAEALPGWDVEIVETHHNQKADAPSGTAKLLLEAIDPQHALTPVYGREGNCGKRDKKEIGMHALRGGTVAGTHTVHFFGPDEEFEITHRATSRQIFVNGALHMARLLPGRANGVYDLQKILFGE